MGADQLHQIGAVADRVGLSLRTIRHYDEVGLVVPTGRSAGGFRLYTDADIDRLRQVKAMKPLGFTLEETGDLMAIIDQGNRGPGDDRPQRDRLVSYVERAKRRCAELDHQLAEARSLAASLDQTLADMAGEVPAWV